MSTLSDYVEERATLMAVRRYVQTKREELDLADAQLREQVTVLDQEIADYASAQAADVEAEIDALTATSDAAAAKLTDAEIEAEIKSRPPLPPRGGQLDDKA